MSAHIEAILRNAAPLPTVNGSIRAATILVSEEAEVAIRAKSKRARTTWIIGAATVAALAVGTNAAAAVTQTLWWSAPNTAVQPMLTVGGPVPPATEVDQILSATFAPGIDDTAAQSKSAFQLAQKWLDDHPVGVKVPIGSQTLSDAETVDANKQGVSLRVALDRKAMFATQDALAAKVTANHNTLITELDAYLSERGIDPTLIAVGGKTGLTTVRH